MKYFEDFRVGETAAMDGPTVGADDIIAFAAQFDPQPLHTDPEAAARGPFGGLIASGWHLGSLLMRMHADRFLSDGGSALGSPGIESCRWLNPLRPGDRLRCATEVLECWPSKSKPMGFVKRRARVTNQHGSVLMELVGLTMYARRPEDGARS